MLSLKSQRVFKICLCFVLLFNLNVSLDFVLGNIKIFGKENSLFPSGPCIKCILYKGAAGTETQKNEKIKKGNKLICFSCRGVIKAENKYLRKASEKAMEPRINDPLHNEVLGIINNYSPKQTWRAVDIYRAAKGRGKYPTPATDTEVNSCFSNTKTVR